MWPAADLPKSTTSPIDLPRNDWSGDMFDRYERRALSRRKSAINDFDQARTQFGTEDCDPTIRLIVSRNEIIVCPGASPEFKRDRKGVDIDPGPPRGFVAIAV